jgi:hypothetical protein
MVVTITSRSTKAEIEAALKKLEKNNNIKRNHKTKKGFDANIFCGVIKLKEDPLALQKKWRNEWE